MQNTFNWLIDLGKVLAACLTIYGVIKGAVTPVLKTLKDLRDALTSIENDLGLLQRERLQSGHALYTEVGYCPSGEKEVLEEIFRRYKKKELNHFTEKQFDDIMKLPEHPPRPRQGKEVLPMGS